MPFTPRTARPGCLLVLALSALLAPAGPAAAQTYTWNRTTGGEWLDTASWSPAGSFPNAVGAVASFGNVITNPATVTLSGSVTVGEINFTGLTGTKAYTIGASGNTITLNNGASPARLSSDASVTSTGTQLTLPGPGIATSVQRLTPGLINSLRRAHRFTIVNVAKSVRMLDDALRSATVP